MSCVVDTLQRARSRALIGAAIAVLGASGCARAATLEEVRREAHRAATDPHTWVPLVGAAVVHAAGWDEPISDWARDAQPIRGNVGHPGGISHAGVALGLAATAYCCGARMARPPPMAHPRWQRIRAAAAAVGAQVASTRLLKAVIDRPRPKGGRRDSMPSGHAAVLASGAAIAREELRRMRLDASTRRAVDLGSSALLFMNGWLRLEAGRHYPTDILVGHALGNAIGLFTYRLAAPRIRPCVRVERGHAGTTVHLGFSADL